MRDLPIAYGSSCQARKWSNKTISYDDLKNRLCTPLRTAETVAEYHKFNTADKQKAKDHGGFVAGVLKGGRRLVSSVTSRSMIALDGDDISQEFINHFSYVTPYTSCFYTTHGHTKDNPRIRLIFPMTRDTTPEEFVAVARYLAQALGIDYFDPCSYLPNQLMYWPSTPSDGQFLFREADKDWLNPDDILQAHPEWNDPSQLPTSSKESHANTVNNSKVQDPLSKDGVVGLFNRTYYPITTVLDELLSDVYESTDVPNRYHFIQSTSMPGVEVIEDKFVYSHNAKDPAYMQLCNAFDIVRIQKFDGDYKKTCTYAMTLDKVKLKGLEEKKKSAAKDFKPDDWKTKLKYMPHSTVLQNSVWNEMLILNNDPDCANFAYNEMANRVQVTGPLAWDRPADNVFWRDADTAQLRAMIDVRYVPFSDRNHNISFAKITDDRRFHPVRDYLDALPAWDKTERVDTLFVKYLMADDNKYVRAVTRKSLVAAVTRIYHPGTKFDTVPVLDGAQGIGKSTMWKSLAGSTYFSDALSLTDMNDKSGAEKLQGFWIIEIGELAGMKKVDVERVKSFLSTSDDKYRPSYGMVVESHPRQCIVVATVNGECGYLRDITGNRRFWIVKCNQRSRSVNWKITPQERDQIWAEVKYYYRHGEKLYLEGSLVDAADQAQISAMEADDRQGMVEQYLSTLLPANWAHMDLYSRREFLSGESLTAKPGTV
jgi:predicted P-loop ATPase